MTRKSVTRLVSVNDEYLDGISAAQARTPTEFDEFVRRVPVDVLDAYEASWTAMREAEKALLAAYAKAPEVRNRKFQRPEVRE